MKKEKVDSFLVRIKFHLKFPFHMFPQKEPPAGALHYGRPLRLGLTAGSFSSACDTAGRPGIRDKAFGVSCRRPKKPEHPMNPKNPALCVDNGVQRRLRR